LNPVPDWWRGALTWRTALLLPAAWLYGALMRCRDALYQAGLLRRARVRVPVIVVGNLTVGGSGKTPLVIHLVDALRARGHRPGVISRGYGARAGDAAPRPVEPDSPAATHGDEPVLIRRRAGCPVFVCPARPAAARALLDAHPEVDVIISDDGLQHLALARDFEIAVFDGRGAGNGRLLPAGPLRENLGRLQSVDAVVAQDAPAIANGALAMRLEFAEFRNLRDPSLRCQPGLFGRRYGGRVAAVAGIGNPARFFAQLRALGLSVAPHAFPDHHAYGEADLAGIGEPLILMTEKDALKCESFSDGRLWVAPVTAVVDDRLVASILEKTFGSQAA
jgi:tetraacyldisaccharide 4'-kinase